MHPVADVFESGFDDRRSNSVDWSTLDLPDDVSRLGLLRRIGREYQSSRPPIHSRIPSWKTKATVYDVQL